jgi:hypothetical protein
MSWPSSRSIVLGLAVAVLAFPLPLAAQGPNTRAMLPGYGSTILLDTLAFPKRVSGQRDSIYVALFKVLGELDIPVEARDRQSGLARNLNVERSRRLGNVPLSRYFDCGRGFAGNNADLYRLTIALSAWVGSASDSTTRLFIASAASGQDPAGSKTGYVMCPSTGQLEERIAQRVRQVLGG